jgi:hypothetical protein
MSAAITPTPDAVLVWPPSELRNPRPNRPELSLVSCLRSITTGSRSRRLQDYS